jgi:hypothetical protein
MNDFRWRKFVSPRVGSSFLAAFLIATFLCLPILAQTPTRAKYMAFYGTNQADWALVSIPASGPLTWKILKNPSSPVPGQAQIAQFDWGISGDSISPGSYTGDNFFDPNISRAGANWTYPYPSNPGGVVTQWGTTGDNFGRNGDYDGDGIEDFTIIRIIGGQLAWWIRPSSAPGTVRVVNFGQTAANTQTFAFEGADFTGDGRDELVMARVINASGLTIWFIGDAVTGQQVNQIIFGDWDIDFIINPGDYTGDGKADIAVYRAGASNPAQWQFWFYNPATNQTLPPYTFGVGDPAFTNMDIPCRGDYDGDGKDDIALFRPSNATYYVIRSTDGAFVVQQWGLPGVDSPDTPLASFFIF